MKELKEDNTIMSGIGVGDECEVLSPSGWERILITAIGRHSVLGLIGIQGYEKTFPRDYLYRPIRTKKEIEREEGINNLIDILDHSTTAREDATSIYDAGYRLVPEGHFIVKPLSEDQLNVLSKEISDTSSLPDWIDVINHIQRELGIDA